MNNHLKAIRVLTKLMDSQFSIFGYRFGLDPIIGFFPVLGDILPITLGFYTAWVGHKMGMEKDKVIQMFINSGLDILVGLIPVIGDLGDFVYKSNTKNLRIIEDFMQNRNVIEGEIVN